LGRYKAIERIINNNRRIIAFYYKNKLSGFLHCFQHYDVDDLSPILFISAFYIKPCTGNRIVLFHNVLKYLSSLCEQENIPKMVFCTKRFKRYWKKLGFTQESMCYEMDVNKCLKK